MYRNVRDVTEMGKEYELICHYIHIITSHHHTRLYSDPETRAFRKEIGSCLITFCSILSKICTDLFRRYPLDNIWAEPCVKHIYPRQQERQIISCALFADI